MSMTITDIKQYLIENKENDIFEIKESSYGYNRLSIDVDSDKINSIIKHIILTDRFKTLHNVSDNDLKLIKRCYFNTNRCGCGMDIKRPFGNSHIEGDISNIYNRVLSVLECEEIINHIINIIISFLTDPLELYEKMDLGLPEYKIYMDGYERKEKIRKLLSS